MLLLKLANKIINKQSKSQREKMTDILIYNNTDTGCQDIRMTYFANNIRYVSHNVINNNNSYNTKADLEAERVRMVLTIDRVHVQQVGSNYEYRYRLCDGDRAAIYIFKGLPNFGTKENDIIKSITVHNGVTGVWIVMEMRDDKPRLITFDLEKVSIIAK